MNHHATLLGEETGGIITRVLACPACGGSTTKGEGIE
jgi:hypothetical protein